MLTLFFVLYFVSTVVWLIAYPVAMTIKRRDPYHDHPYSRWRFAEHQAKCAAGACTTGLALYLGFNSHIPQDPITFVKLHLATVTLIAILLWAQTRGPFALVPNLTDLPAYIRYQIGPTDSQ